MLMHHERAEASIWVETYAYKHTVYPYTKFMKMCIFSLVFITSYFTLSHITKHTVNIFAREIYFGIYLGVAQWCSG